MKKLTIALFIFLTVHEAWAGDGEYSVDKIPAGLLEHAHVVIRKQQQHIEVKNLGKMVLSDKFAITVLDEQGDMFAYVHENYDKFTDIDEMDGTLYDASGKKIRSLKKSEIVDGSVSSEGTLAMDTRYKMHSFYYKVYPYTVEYESRVTKKETMFFPNWAPVWTANMSVMESSITITVPRDYVFRYKLFNTEAPSVTDKKDEKEYLWHVENLKAIEKEYASPAWHELAPYIVMAPSEFMIEDYKGSMTDWKEVGKFHYTLNQGRDVLPDGIKTKVHQLTEGLATKQQKVQALYDFLQHNTRYISIQLGIGGWRPFEASYVANNAYGDCKALSNYMVALLKEAGITAYYCLIRAGDDEQDITADFPSEQFNHVIACVPDAKDTIWLECTSQTTPAGYMGSFTGNRHALIITEEGGKLVTTPKYTAKENLQVRNINAEIDAEGHLKAVVQTNYKAVQQDNLHGLINGLSKEKVMEFLKEEIDLPNYDVQKFDYKERREKIPAIIETLELTGDNYAAVTGKRLFISPNVLTKSHRKLKTDETRKYDVNLEYEYRDIDTVEIKLPAGYEPESIPQDVSVSTKFGSYSASVKVVNDKILYYRSIEQYSGRFSAKDYNELVKYYDQVYKADRNRVVLVRKA
jgi:hypothetical protein